MTLRTLCVHNGSIHGCLSFNFPDSQQLYNSANPDAPWGGGWPVPRRPCAAVTHRSCHVPFSCLLVAASKGPACFMLGLVVNHQWIASSVLLCLKQPWALIRAALWWQNDAQGTETHEELFQCKRALSCFSPLFPLNHSPLWAGAGLID